MRGGVLDTLDQARVTTFCAPPTVWRMLIQEDLTTAKVHLREALAAGEPLNPEVIEQVQRCLGADHPRRIWPDRDDAADRQHARPRGAGGVHGVAATRLCRGAAGPGWRGDVRG